MGRNSFPNKGKTRKAAQTDAAMDYQGRTRRTWKEAFGKEKSNYQPKKRSRPRPKETEILSDIRSVSIPKMHWRSLGKWQNKTTTSSIIPGQIKKEIMG